MGMHSRELLLAATRAHDDDEVDQEDLAVRPRPAPGKRSSDVVTADAASPVSYSEWFGPIDRRADGTAQIDPDGGALATAFSFVESSTGRSLPTTLMARLSMQLGVDLRRVRVFDDEAANKACAAVGARAFATGENIYFAAGAYDPSSPEGIELIAHEVAHVAQQLRGSRTTSAQISQPGDAHERDADAFAQTFARHDERDPANVVNQVRSEGERVTIPFRAELEEQLGMPLDFIETYTGDAARIACELMAASAFAVSNVVAFADPSPQREVLLHELAHVMQMGGKGTRAPDRFGAGTLRVGDRDAPAEHDAQAAVRGEGIGVTASADVIHRADPADKPQPFNIDDAFKRVEAFTGSLPKLQIPEAPVFGKPGDEAVYYTETTKEPFRIGDYRGYSTPKNPTLKEEDFDKDLSQVHSQRPQSNLKKVGSKDSKTWAWVKDQGAVDPVAFLKEEYAKHAGNVEKYNGYCESIAALKHLTAKPKMTVPNKADFDLSVTDQAKIYTDKQLSTVRETIRTAIIAEPNYKLKDDEWKTFFDDVVDSKKKLPQAMVGEIFEKIALRDITAKGQKAVTKIYFDASKHKELTNDVEHIADGVLIEGTALKITEFKSGPSGIGSADDADGGSKKLVAQAKAYANIIQSNIPAVDIPGVKHVGPFTQCIYVFPTADMSKSWGPKLAAVFSGVGAKARTGLVIYPPAGDDADGKPIATLTFNPTFKLPLEKDKTSHTIKNPPLAHSGVNFKQVTVTTKAPNSSEIVSGEVVFDVDLQGGVTAKDTKSPITPGDGGAKVQNEKFAGLKSKFDKVFKGRVDVDAKLIEGGVEATLTVKEGPSGIPNLLLKGSVIKVTYTAGKLTAEGSIELSNTKGNLHGKAKVSWDGSDFGFEGEATMEEGMIDGLGRVTGTVAYVAGSWKFGIAEASYTKSLKAVTLTGKAFGLEYDTKTGGFSGLVELEADLGMFGTASASAELKDNKLKSATFSYDSPVLKYPAKSDKPTISGTVGGTLKYNDGKFSGDIRGSANINIPGLQKIAKDGVGLAVDAHIGEDGSYNGTISTTKQIKLGKYLEINGLSCKLEKDGSITGGFDIAIVGVKGVTAKAKGTIDKAGVHIEKAEATVAFGNPEGKFWGSLTVSYSSEKGFDVEGTANYKIKDGLTATGIVKYTQETNAISVELKTTEITLLDKTIKKQLFKASKQFPIVNVYGLGIYVDIGFDLGFDFGFKITMAPSVKVEDFSLETLEFKRIAAKLEVGGDIYAALTGTPKLGLGVFALDPSILRGGGGLKVPIVGRLDVKPKATFEVGYSPDGGADASAKLGIAGEFGIKGSVSPYAEFSVLNDAWNPKWEGQPLASFEILKPQELFNFTVDLNSKEKQADPELPGENAAKAPTEPQGDKTAKAAPAAGAGGTAEAKGGSKDSPAKQGEAPSGGEDGPFSLTALMGKLKTMPGFATAEKLFGYAKKVWAVVKPIWDIVEPLMDIIAKRIEEIIGLFDPGPSADGLGQWLWKLAKLLFNLSFGGITEVASAIKTLLGKAAGFAKKLINKAVQDGHIGVKRHAYYIWMPWPKDDIRFMAAAEWKVNIPGVANLGEHEAPGFLLTPSGAVGLVLYEALGAAGVGYTYVGESSNGQPYNDRWTGSGARG